MLGLYPHTEALRQVAVSRFRRSPLSAAHAHTQPTQWLGSIPTHRSATPGGSFSFPTLPHLHFLQPFYGFLLSPPWPTHPPSFTPTAGRLLTLLRLGVAPMSISRPQALSTAVHLWNSQELGTDSFCTSRLFGGWDSDRFGIFTQNSQNSAGILRSRVFSCGSTDF